MSTPRLLSFVLVMQVVTVIGLLGAGRFEQPARADLPNPAPQREEMIDQLKNLNDKMDHLITILESGKLQVRVSAPDDNKENDAGK